MIEREQNELIFLVCDECGESLKNGPYDNDEFEEMISDAKTQGWGISPIGDDWQHHCSKCKETPLQRAKRIFSN